MDVQRVAALLEETELFSGLGAAEVGKIAELANERRYKKGALIFYQGDPGDAFYVVAEGSVKVFVQSGQGEEMVLVTLRPPDSLGEVALLDEGQRSASAEALEPTTLMAFARSTMLQLLHDEPAIADGLLRSVGAMLRRLTEQASDFVFLDLEGRIAKVLTGFAEQRGEAKGDEISLDLGLTQTELAHMVGGSRQSVNQILHSLEDRNYLDVGGCTIVIKNLDGLRKRAGRR
ncbi:MAG: Crp/Fnr family transcriptional regulator [Actinomycetota bacterium]